MKPTFRMSSVALALLAVSLFQCSGNKKSENTSDSTASAPRDTPPDNTVYVGACIWDQVPLRETPDDKGKYKTAISIGQVVTLFTDTAGNGKFYTKVRLNDGMEGFAKKDFIVPNGTPSVFSNDADTYSHPDLLNKNKDKKFSKYDIVAIAATAVFDFFLINNIVFI